MSREETGADLLTVGFHVLLLAWVVALTYWATRWDSWRDQLFPLLVTVPTALLVVVQLVRFRRPDLFGMRSRLGPDEDRRPPRTGRDDVESADAASNVETERLLVVFCWVAAFPVAIYYLGFVLSIPLFLFGFVGYLLGDWRKAAGVTALVTVFVVVLFVSVLNVELWEGVLDPLP